MTKCSVKKCFNNNQKTRKNIGIYFFRFPQNRLRRAEWAAIIARDRQDPQFKPSPTGVVCSSHFAVSDIYTTQKGINRLTATAKPVLNMSEIEDDDIQSHSHSGKDIKPAQMLHSSGTTPPASTSLSIGSMLDSPCMKIMKDELRMCRKEMEDKDKTIKNLKKQNRRLRKKISSLKNIVSILNKLQNIDHSVFHDLSKHV